MCEKENKKAKNRLATKTQVAYPHSTREKRKTNKYKKAFTTPWLPISKQQTRGLCEQSHEIEHTKRMQRSDVHTHKKYGGDNTLSCTKSGNSKISSRFM